MTPSNKVQGEQAHLLSAKEEKESYGSIVVGDEKGLEDSDGEPPKTHNGVETPLPWKQMLVVCIMRLAEPIAYSQVIPVRMSSSGVGRAGD